MTQLKIWAFDDTVLHMMSHVPILFMALMTRISSDFFFSLKLPGSLNRWDRYTLEEKTAGPSSWRFGSDHFPFFSWVMAVGSSR